MKKLLKLLSRLDVCFMAFLCFYACAAIAQTVVTPQDFLTQVLAFIQSWGGLATVLKVAGVITLIISSMKVTYLNTLIWSKIPTVWQPWIAPILGLAAGIFGLGQSGAITPASVFAYAVSGAGAIIIHELLDMVKVIPGVSFVDKLLIDALEGFFGGGEPVASLQAKQKVLQAKIDERLARGRK